MKFLGLLLLVSSSGWIRGEAICESFPGELNVALYGKADQSSVYQEEGMPEHAIDGNKNSNYVIKSCTHTIPETGPWWRVDLKKPHQISRVAITNRGDCCAERLEGAEVRIGNSLDNNGNNNPKCGAVESTSAGSTHTFCCSGMEGRYVSIVIPGRKDILSLCEVEVFGIPAECPKLNVALHGTADQSSVYQEEGMPEHAIDGNKNSNYMIKSCTHTIPEMGPWWRVDLKKPHQISRVAITNRGDCCAERLEGAEVRIGNSLDNNGNNNPKCGAVESTSAWSTHTFCCSGMEGRYVSIVIPGRKDVLSLCEVEIFGIPAECPSFLGGNCQTCCACELLHHGSPSECISFAILNQVAARHSACCKPPTGNGMCTPGLIYEPDTY
ncbi:uncharacterized protein LOC102349841 [Latimeria chalumnae]|uniref:uncharacterized protein LOC102349841 n=1 Tax=Latimeria chalumnae TaxID=7897 RepID=UPI00313DDEBE